MAMCIEFGESGDNFLRKRGETVRKSRFDRKTEEVLRGACLLAREFGHSYVGSEHILLSLARTRECRASQLLAGNHVTYERLRGLTERVRGQGGGRLRLPQGLSAGAQRVIRTALAQTGTREQVAPEQLLWAIAAENATTAALLLVSCGVCVEQLCVIGTQAQERRDESMRLLEQYGINMVERAGSGSPVIGRGMEIDTMIEVLCRKHKNNPALVGDPGVGKTAIVEGLAQRMAAGQVPAQLRGRRLYALDTASMVAGTKYRGEFEERMRDLLGELSRAGNVIVFIDEMHMLVGAGAAEGAIDAANILKPALSRGEIQLIGATTAEEYRKYIEKDAALERRFRKIPVSEPTGEQSIEILRGLRPGLEQHHGLAIGDDAIEAAVRLSQRYLTEYFLPDKALDLLDEGAAHACLCARRKESSAEAQRRGELDDALRRSIAQEDFAKALAIQEQIQALHGDGRPRTAVRVGAPDIAYAVSSRTGIPAGQLEDMQRERLGKLEEALSARVIGQEAAIRLTADAVRRGRTGVCGENRPVASILLTGPTGVGKTELCKALAECVYGSPDAMIRLDMTEYMERISVSRLVGAPPGYVGYEEGGMLTEKVRRRPYSLVLFDELDKAHPDVTGMLLQIMDDGMLTDSTGRRVDFTNTLILMTANLGAQETGRCGLGFAPSAKRERTMAELRQHFPAEFLGRLDAVAVFEPLSDVSLAKIARRSLSALSERLRVRGIGFTYDEAVPEHLAAGAERQSGARALRHAISQKVEAPLARKLLESEAGAFHLGISEGTIAITEA